MGSVRLGSSGTDAVVISKELRETHMHVLGQSRMGKSYFLEHLIRQDIMAGSGVCVIDPHGELYDNIVQWLAVTHAAHHRKVHLINPSADGWSVGFNPFCAGDSDPSVRVDFMIKACKKVWNADAAAPTPRLDKCLQLVFYALAVNGLSILEARKFSQTIFKEERLRLTKKLPHWGVQKDWDEFNAYKPADFMAYMESTNSRLIPFANKPRIERLMGQTENVIDFKQCMDRGDIVLVNLAGKGHLSDEDARLIGALLFADLFVSAKNRDIRLAKQRPFYCYVDECADYITTDVAKALDQTAKFGLHLVLAHHRMSQLLQYGEDFCDTIMAGAQTKVVFRIDADDAAEELSRHLFRREFDIERRKVKLTNPVVVGQEIVRLNSESRSRSSAISISEGHTESRSSGRSEGAGTSTFVPEEGDGSGYSESESASSSYSDSVGDTSSRTETVGETLSHGSAETFKSIFEERGVPYTLEELVHEGTTKIRTLPKRTCFVYLPGAKSTVQMATDTITPAITLPSIKAKSIEHFVSTSDFTTADEEISRAILLRRQTPTSQVVNLDENDEDQFRIPNR